MSLKSVHQAKPGPTPVLNAVFRYGRKIIQLPNRFVNKGIVSKYNPLTQTGAIANLLFAIAVVSGVALLIWYRPSVHQAYDSLQAMESNIFVHFIRSLHRYSSDGVVLLVFIHSLKYFFDGRIGGARWLAWVSGFISLFLLWVIGWTGYWLVWDERASAIALGTAKMMDLLPIFADPLSRSFLTDETMNSLLFFLIFFFHMLLPLAMAAGLWIHIQRLNRSNWITDKPLTLAVVASLIAVSFAYPATSAMPAKMQVISESYTMDYWYLLPIYFTDRLSGGALWAFFMIAAVLILSAPWLLVRKKKEEQKAFVNEDICNDCQQCYVDCPYNAITMIPRLDGKYESVARVDPAKCLACGICSGSCLPQAIDLPHNKVIPARRQMNERRTSILTMQESQEPFMAAYLCASSVASEFRYDAETGQCGELPGYKVEAVPCSGWVHARTIEHLVRGDTGGVLVAACPPGECCYREGADWTHERLDGIREPELREKSVNFNRVLRIEPETKSDLLKQAASFRDYIRNLKNGDVYQKRIQPSPNRAKASLVAALLVGAFSSILLIGSDLRYTAPFVNEPQFVVSFKHPGVLSESCRKATEEELAAMPMHMRREQICERRRQPVRLRLSVDGVVQLTKDYKPDGIWQDGTSLAVEHLSLSEGEHTIKVEIGDSNDVDSYQYVDEQEIELKPRFRRVVLFERGRGFTWY